MYNLFYATPHLFLIFPILFQTVPLFSSKVYSTTLPSGKYNVDWSIKVWDMTS